jgi:hypothetical protein
MRWPFHFGRSAVADKAPVVEASAPRRRLDWASLPPIQRAIGEPELTAPTAQFVDSLAGSHDPDLSLEPLGHHVSLDAPHGLITGIARSFETYAPSTELIGRPRPRRGVTAQREPFAPDVMDAGEPVESREPAEDALPVLAPRSVTVVDEAVPSHAPLTLLTDSDRAAVMSITFVRRSREVAQEAAHEPPATATATEAPVRPVSAQRLTLGQSRRLGLGAPLTHVASAPVQRSSASPASLDLAPAPRNVTGADDSPEAPSDAVSGSAINRPGAEPDASMHAVPLIGRNIRAETPHAALDSREPERVPTPEASMRSGRGRSIATESTASKPALAAPSIQRVTARSLPPLYPLVAAATTVPLAPDRLPILASRRAIQAADDSAAEPQATGQLRPAAIPEPFVLPELADQIKPVLSLAPLAEERHASSAATLPLRSPLAPPTVVQRVGSARGAAFANEAGFEPAVITAPAYGMRPSEPAVQREVVAGESPAPAAAAESPPAAAAANPSAGAASPQSEKDLDELARKLHDRISAQIRYDLLIDRERAGVVTDLR